MQAANRVLKNTMFLYAKMGITVFISLYVTRLILNALGAHDFGLFTLIGGFVTLLTFLNVAMTSSSQRYMSYAEGKGDFNEQVSIFNISVVLHVGVGIVLIGILEAIAPFLFGHVFQIEPERLAAAKDIYHFAVLSALFMIVSVPYDAVINAHENMLFVAILGVFESLLKLGSALLVVAYAGDKLVFFGFAVLIISVTVFAVKGVYCHRQYREVRLNPVKYHDAKLLKKMFSFAGYSTLGSTSSMVSNYGQGIVLNMFYGTIVNAAQGIGGQVSGQLSAFAATMMKALNPLIAKSEGAGNRKLMLQATYAGTKFSFFLLIFFYIPFFVEMPVILDVWLKDVPEYTLVFTTLMLSRNLVEQLFLTLNSAIAATGNIKHFQIFHSLLTLVPLVVSYLLFMMGFKPFTLYVVYLLYAVAHGGLVLYFAKKEAGLSIRSYFIDVIFPTVISLVVIFAATALAYILVPQEPWRFGAVVLTSSAAFAVTVWTLGMSRQEREYALRVIRRRRNRSADV
ncbi:MATE family efflux transporter [Sulfurimonas sp. HSL-1656]|uniref:MATE family efflux transporter n=1 Tax=Thiomicrolovo subterrani TaxID=3131934 RepID=UPI0031F77F5B